MKTKKYLLALYLIIQSFDLAFGAYLTNSPHTITQPSGQVINCYLSGDEFYHWLHDINGYTIKQDSITGNYCYAILQNSKLIASQYIVGVTNPASVGITPGINISSQQVLNITNTFNSTQPARVPMFNNMTLSTSSTKILNNIVVYIRFSDQQEFPANQMNYTTILNDTTLGSTSVARYFKEMSYNKVNTNSTFYPINNGTSIVSYKDCHTRNYYLPQSAIISYTPIKYNIDSGFPPNDQNGLYRERREMELVRNAINAIKNQVSNNINLDINDDGNIDNICFIIKGGADERDSPLYSHKWSYVPTNNLSINSKFVFDYNFIMENSTFNSSTICHEMSHTFGAPDLYYDNGSSTQPVGIWDIMSGSYLVSSGAYLKYKYLKWISDIPLITQSGHYTLLPITSETNNCYKIPSSNANEFFVLEFRQKAGVFESSLPGSGVLIYRINTAVGCNNGKGGNSCGPPDEVYIYRPNGTLINNGNINLANFDVLLSRGIFNALSNPNCFLSNNSIENFIIKNITVIGSTASFDVRLCQNSDITLSNTNQLPEVSNAVNTIQTNGSVVVKSTDNITFEAGQEITLYGGFEVKQGGKFEVNIVQCGN